MAENDDGFALLEDIAARVIFYSCLSKPKSIPKIAELWDYKTSAYFYQEARRKIIKNMENKGLVRVESGREGGISSNYDLVIEKKRVDNFFKKQNEDLTKTIISTGWTPEQGDPFRFESQLENKMFREYCMDKIEGLRERVNEVVFKESDVKHFAWLWRHNLFRELFVSADFIKSIHHNRDRLPQNPLDFLYGVTLGICQDISFEEYNIKSSSFLRLLINPEGPSEDYSSSQSLAQMLSTSVNERSYEILNCSIEALGSFWRKPKQSLKLTRVAMRIEKIAKILVKKLEAFPPGLEPEHPHLSEFIEKMGFWTE